MDTGRWKQLSGKIDNKQKGRQGKKCYSVRKKYVEKKITE